MVVPAPGRVHIVTDDDDADNLTVQERLDTLETRQIEMMTLIQGVDEKINNLLKGLQEFLKFTESMKGHPLLSAFAPTQRK